MPRLAALVELLSNDLSEDHKKVYLTGIVSLIYVPDITWPAAASDRLQTAIEDYM